MIGLSCLVVTVVIVRCVQDRNVSHSRGVWLLSGLIAVSAATHLLNAATFMWPDFDIENVLMLVSAMAAAVVAFLLCGALPNVLHRSDAKQHESEIVEGRTDLECSRQQAIAIVVASPVDQIVVDFSGVIVNANPMAEEIFGYSRSELVGEPIEILVPKSEREIHRGLRDEFIRKPVARKAAEGRNLIGLHRSGAQIPIQIGLAPLDIGDGQAVLCSIVDLSERRRVDEVQRRFHLKVRDLATKLKGASTIAKNSSKFWTPTGSFSM